MSLQINPIGRLGCMSREADIRWACSETDAWYTMDELLETAAV